MPQCFCLIALSIRCSVPYRIEPFSVRNASFSSFRTELSHFLYETAVSPLSVQDRVLFCTKHLFLLFPYRIESFFCTECLFMLDSSRFAPSTCSFSNNLVDWCRIESFSVRNDRLSTISLNGWIEMKRKICKCWKSATYRFGLYPEPGSNRHASRHWCLRPARLPIPPSGH